MPWKVPTHIARAGAAEQSLHTGAHLGSSLIGERDGENAARRDALGFHEPGDAMHQHAGLAAACAATTNRLPGGAVTASR